MPRVVSFIVLLAIVLLIGSMFFQVMAQFIVPLFLAAVLVVIFKPLHLWILEKCGHRYKISAVLTTLAIFLIVLLPITGLFVQAVTEGLELYNKFHDPSEGVAIELIESPLSILPSGIDLAGVANGNAEEEPPADQPADTEKQSDASLTADEQDAAAVTAMNDLIDRVVIAINGLTQKFGLPALGSEQVHSFVNEHLENIATPIALGSVKIVASTLFGLVIMLLTMYYFFADGPNMTAGLMKLSPLDDKYEQELLDKFGDVSRAVVVAVLLSSVVQGLLAGVGYYFAGVQHIFFLTVATTFLAMVPFVGAAAVWLPVCAVLYFYTGATTSALVLAIYCGTIVSMSDNVVKPIVLHGQSNLHPLLALLSVIGGIQVLGPIGILVGPMLVAFLQALLNMLNKELHLLGKQADEEGTPVVFATGAASENPTTEALPQPQPQKKTNTKRKKGKKGK